MKKFFLSFFLFIIGSLLIQAQDIHFSYFQLQPVHLNPALTGHFEGTTRVGGIYRDQGRVVSAVGNYATPSFYLDSPVIRGFGENDWIGVGLSLTADGAGSSRLKTTISGLSLSYHLSLDEDRSNILSFGASMSSVSRKFGKDKFDFYDEIDGNGNFFGTTMEGDVFTEFSFGDPFGMPTTYTSWTGGLVFTAKPNRQNSFQFGATLAHINKPNQSIASVSRDSLSRRLTAYASMTTLAADRLKITPTILYQKKSVNSELVVQAIADYLFNPDKDIVLKGGLGFRLSGHPILYFGFQKGDLNIGASYDIDMSTLRQGDKTVGAFEIGASYIIKIYKKPDPDPVIFCPRF